jgi:uncharacterized protein (TIGR02246 family)
MHARSSATQFLQTVAALAAFGFAAYERAADAQAPSRTADETAIKAVIQAFVDTREKNDPAGLGALLTADVDQQQTSGGRRAGRDAVVAGSLATQRETGGTRTISLSALRFISADVAIADGRYDSLGRSDGTDQLMLTSMVLRRETDGWKIAAIRNSLPTAPAAR